MAMLRVSSYRKLFEEGWGRNGGVSLQCAGQYRARNAAIGKCDCDKLDFVASRTLNKEGLNRFVHDRVIIAALNDRLVKLIELAHCFEEENESLECQIVDLEDRLGRTEGSISSTVAVPESGLDAVVQRLRAERDEILCDSETLRKELERLKEDCEKTSQQRTLVQQERQYVSEDVDAVTAECLALREQVAIYEEQLVNMEGQHETAVVSLLEPAEETTGAVAAIKFGIPDITSALDVKEYYCQLAESLQYECGVSSSALVRSDDGKLLEAGEAVGSKVKSPPQIKDIGEMKALVSEMQKKLEELEKYNEELEEQFDINKTSYAEEIAELECTIDEMKHQEADLQFQMKEQCEDYRELLREKMARDMEICAYRSLVEEEEQRLCIL
ncbi:peripherin [Boleophthalmus pectinirostris]|uniref:peripherin n=1 Tax=Boleophthalmus pectinirostris TaxID=150288 RepID=UPI00242A850E|nr:peripherin [Boleophthalmus pectinirostris]